jgi:two-component system, OmpR family, sensor histidine kinase CpxA
MKLPVHSLFLKIFLWFWATAIATAISLILTFIFGPGNSVPSRWHSTLADTARSSGMIAVEELARGGVPAASAYIERFERETQLRACLFDRGGQPIAGRNCATFSEMQAHVTATRKSDFAIRYGILRVASLLPGPDGKDYIFATELPAGPRAALGVNVATVLTRGGVALLVSGLICYLLVRYLTAPILRLQEASQQLAAGDLTTRADLDMERRQDELGALVRDFNVMANRIEELVSRQRQLIYDISHEFRSPLARLNVALDIGRERKGADPAFDRMERDLVRLNDMIGRLLTIARLDSTNTSVEMSPLDLTELVAQIVHDAGFESQERKVIVNLKTEDECLVRGNADLLHSAIENVIRNAIRYTEEGTSIDVLLQCGEASGMPRVKVAVRDSGPGIPESDLKKIFEPFYRTAHARDRESGGAGLGLAIADRVIRFHSGTISAGNLEPKGLEIKIDLPAI